MAVSELISFDAALDFELFYFLTGPKAPGLVSREGSCNCMKCLGFSKLFIAPALSSDDLRIRKTETSL